MMTEVTQQPPSTSAQHDHGSAKLIFNWLKLAESALGNNSDRLNAINIFPVPDGDTGSNLYHTVAAATRALEDVDANASAGIALTTAATAALDHAQGNSGTLIAVMLNALAEPLSKATRLTAPLLALGLQRASAAAWAALSDPQEGTMLTILDTAAATAANFRASITQQPEDQQNSRKTLGQMTSRIVETVWLAVEETENQLAELSQAQVVDAGATGLLLVFDALRATVQGESLDPEILESIHGFHVAHPHVHQDMQVAEAYEVMCSLQLTPLDAATLRIGLNEVGNSVIMSPINTVEDDNGTIRWRVHVHVAEPDDAMKLIRPLGETENLAITPLHAGNTTVDAKCHPVTEATTEAPK
ncbi:MAG TPA: DAK2 domain-containing protein [Enteractinococcus helveticum]|uniref:DAK2 domain-containing protein n=1 Tax=Enteractinococcus helveticum TaxID=1837282 RepID=A0A921FMD7_9MICC|nr:DAK2 domain-containing protein [Enteractinococcus helveticum]HJF13917.1 DAK2 domain-containing protein [Enteractinococcus helveticum]